MFAELIFSSHVEILGSKFQFINNTSSNYGDFVYVNLPEDKQLSIHQQNGTVVAVTFAIESLYLTWME